MAETKMVCPFSKELCRDCPVYRGRHYYLCFCTKYRGYLGNQNERTREKSNSSGNNKKFEMPPVLPPSPTWLTFDDFAEWTWRWDSEHDQEGEP